MGDEWLAELIAGMLQRVRRRLAPEGSRRARLARSLYTPLLRSMEKTEQLRRIDPAPRCERLPPWTIPPLPPGGRVLVLKLDHIGDFVLALPALQTLRRALPDAEIMLVCGTWNLALAERSGVADRVVAFDAVAPIRGGQGEREEQEAADAAFALLAREWGRFDLAIDLRHEPDTRRLLSLVDARVRAGFAAYGAAGAALDIALANAERVAGGLGNGRPMHAQARLSMLVATVLASVRPDPLPARCLLTPGAARVVAEPYVVLAPGAGAPVRAWPAERVVELAQLLARQHGLRIVLLGGKAEAPLTASIAAALTPDAALDLGGRVGMDAVPDIIAGARLFIGMDTGLTHLAAALGVPTVCVFSGAARREVWQPIGTRLLIVAGRTACSPCYLAQAEQCPHDQACLTVIGTGEVLAACDTLLGEAA
jgi:heptosyltransferase II